MAVSLKADPRVRPLKMLKHRCRDNNKIIQKP
jgi:hypothetical protein